MTINALRPLFPSHGWTRLAFLGAACLAGFLLGPETPALCASPAAKSRQRPAEDGISAKIVRYAERLLDRYDRDGDGRLQEAEWSEMLVEKYDRNRDRRLGPDEWEPTRIEQYDSNQDGFLEEKEWRSIWGLQRLPPAEAGLAVDGLVRAIAKLGGQKPIVLKSSHLGAAIKPRPLLSPATRAGSPAATSRSWDASEVATSPKPGGAARGPADRRRARGETKFFVSPTRLPRGLPTWFLLRDADGDAQLTLAEFAPKATQSLLADFDRYDRNGDGLITAEECARGPKPTPKPREQQAGQEVPDEILQHSEQLEEDSGGEAEAQTTEKEQDAAARAASLRRQRPQKKAGQKGLVKKPVKKSPSQNP